jgi:Histidine kinase-, DNA gyrase B-, and HSP90-like ATPase
LIKPMNAPSKAEPKASGRLRIGDHWNAITILALSQSNPLKAVAEFVENSIDAKARNVIITRGKEHGVPYLRIKDDGEGVRRTSEGVPDFHYVATHICDSIKRQMKREGAEGIQGEFGIGLLSFWTVGEELTLISGGASGKSYQMQMRRGQADYRISQRRTLLPEGGTELVIRRILPGIRQFSGEKLQWYLASELRERIRHSGVQVRVVDRTARMEYKVEPRQFDGRLLHELERAIPTGSELYVELYLTRLAQENSVGLYRSGTRVLDNLAAIPTFQRDPWTDGCLEGIVDAPWLNLTPGTRTGVIQDEALDRLARELGPTEARLRVMIAAQRRAEEEQASRDVLRSIQRALKEALLALPVEEYDWFNVRAGEDQRLRPPSGSALAGADESGGTLLRDASSEAANPEAEPGGQREFFQCAGPLFSVRISSASSVLHVGGIRTFRAIARDRSRRSVEENLARAWRIAEGEGSLDNPTGEIVTFRAPNEPGLTKLQVAVSQGEVRCEAEALLTITESLVPESKAPGGTRQGIPGYTYRKATGELWRSRYDAEQNVVVINNGHRDFVFASRNKALKLRYIARLFSKELVLRNFVEAPPDQLLERLIELGLYTEENLK